MPLQEMVGFHQTHAEKKTSKLSLEHHIAPLNPCNLYAFGANESDWIQILRACFEKAMTLKLD